jgi:hypothetical protein
MNKLVLAMLVLNVFVIQNSRADSCIEVYRDKVNDIVREQIPELNKEPGLIGRSVAHIGATVVGGFVGGVVSILPAVGTGCMEAEGVGCKILDYGMVLAGAVIGNTIVYFNVDKVDNSPRNDALAKQKHDLDEYQTPYLAILEAAQGKSGPELKQVSDMVSARNPAVQSMPTEKLNAIITALNANYAFCPSKNAIDLDHMILQITNAINVEAVNAASHH